MCGRFDFHGDAADLEGLFGVAPPKASLPARYNVAPTQTSPVIVAQPGEGMVIQVAHFGWRRSFLRGGSVINARAETVLERPMFRNAFTERRCVIPAHGFFEWEKADKKRLPWYFKSTQHLVFALAGIYDPPTEKGPAGFVILTTQPNAKVAPYHNRMPVMLSPAAAKSYLHGPVHDAGAMMAPYPAGSMSARRVSPNMNRAGTDGPDCIAPL